MKKQHLLKSMLLLCALIVGSSCGWATDVLFYTLDGTITGSGNAYNSANAITQSGMNWKVTGNTQMNPWRIGGKSTTPVDRPVYSETEMGAVISKIEFDFGSTISNKLTINSVTLTVSTESNGAGTEIDEVVKTTGFTANGTLTFNPSAGKEWSKNAFYTLTFNITTDDTSNNYYLQFKSAKFYTQSYEITAVSNNDSYGTVDIEGFTITATPNSGYRVISGTGGYTVTSGTATVTNNGDNTFTVDPTSDCTVTINFEAIPSHKATFSVNGVENSTTYLEGADIVFPSNPSSLGGKVFKGWIKTPIVGTTDTEPAEYFTSGVMSTGDVSYYAVFATESTGEGNITKTITIETDNFPTKYGTAKTFTEYTLEGVKFKIQQACINNSKLQWRSGTDTSNGAGTMYNTDALSKIQSIVLTYDGDTNKNFTVKVGDSENPTSGTSIDPSASGDVYTFDCSSYNKSYFVLTNGDKAGYLASIAITYRGTTTTYNAYCTSIAPVSVSVGAKGYATYCNATSSLNFTGKSIAAYTIACTDGSALTLTQKDKVAKDEPVLLYSSKKSDSQDIPVIADSEATTDGTNKLVKGTGAALTWSDTDKFYVLITSGEPGFYKANNNIVAVTKAYLDLSGLLGGAHSFTLDLDEGNTTGIANISSEKEVKNGAFYNLAGQKVAQPTKGLYIMNGKKVIIK